MHIYAQAFRFIQMKNLANLLSILFLLSPTTHSLADLYEGFELTGKHNATFGQENIQAGINSYGWMSTWQIGKGNATFSNEDITFDNLYSMGGSAKVIGERKEQHIGKGF